MPTTVRPQARIACLIAAFTLSAAACEEAPTAGPTPGPGGPVDMAVLLDTTATLEATFTAFDTFRVTAPQGSALGVIIESDGPVAVQMGAYQAISPGATFAAIAPEGTSNQGFVRVIHGDWSDEAAENPYRLRLIAVRPGPEHAGAALEIDGDLTEEWIDTPLDVDLYSINLAQGDRFRVEASSTADRPVSIRIETPGGAANYATVATGVGLTASEIFVAQTTGAHRIRVFNTGMVPGVTSMYRFRVTTAPPAD